MKKRTLTTYDIARYCDVSPRTAIQWITEKKMESYRTPGNHCRVKVEDFIEFLKNYKLPIPNELTDELQIKAQKRILIVDDDQDMARSIERSLQRKRIYSLELAFDGFEAGIKLASFKPDLVILDIRMPGMDGYAVTEKIKAFPELKKTKILAISAFFEEEGRKKILELGAQKCMDKPFNRENMLLTVEELLK